MALSHKAHSPSLSQITRLGNPLNLLFRELEEKTAKNNDDDCYSVTHEPLDWNPVYCLVLVLASFVDIPFYFD